MDFTDALQSYFRGERIEALFYILPAGLALAGVGVTALAAYRDGFGWGLAIPALLFGLILLVTGAAIGLRTPPQVSELLGLFQTDPAAMLTAELPRMAAVNANWPRLVLTWGVLATVGLGLRFAVRADWAHGVGPVLIAVGGLGLFIDGFAERRARPYTAALNAQAAQHGLAPIPMP